MTQMKRRKKILLLIWLIIVISALYLSLFHRIYLLETLKTLLSGSAPLAYILLFTLGVFRGFTLIPSTLLIVAGLLFIPAWPLFLIILSGIMLSSLSVYYFFEYLELETLFTKKHSHLLKKGTYFLNKYELPVITIWSMTPFLPTDVVCYLAGTLRVNIYKFLLGILIGEGIICALYIWGGKALLHTFSIL